MDAFVSLPEPSARAGHRYFSVAEANRALVLVRRIVLDIVRNYRAFCELHEAYQAHDTKGNVVMAEDARRQYARVTDLLAELREELDDIGCDLKDYEVGLVDFPSLRDGREILLCWKLGEDRVDYWHEVDSGFGGRRLIAEQA